MRSRLLLVLGWGLVLLGVVLYPLPGPGLLALAAGVHVLARADERVAARLAPWRERGLRAAARSVATWPRTLASLLGTTALAAAGVLWLVDPAPPSWWGLPGWAWLPGGTWSGVAQIASGALGVALVLWSRARLGGTAPRPRGPGGAWKALGWWGP
ncbi:hypothetical protein JOE61_001818 [Nocardioides salarius]|uniref:Uncharacterized protein n=1 Tax=Nocardioides salarius TaxID=374513 RepID=A0ABS2MA05_9ACTN|nr:PGPGW domain-containing protein [Nocardioides salarius]MBM7508004.1 hypothetical protein [Nocardioides salarius]